MKRSYLRQGKLRGDKLISSVALVLISSITVASCGSNSPPSRSSLEQAPATAEAPMNDAAPQSAKVAANQDQVPRGTPQLIKTAELDLVVDSIETTLTKISEVLKGQQGDVIELENNKPQDNLSRHTARLRLRVPQQNLDATISQLSQLGSVERQSLMAEDVSDRLVDSQAALRNLRKSETALLKIMERSGSVGDVLKVAQELTNVRAQIEQIDAQLKDLQNQVAFSVITVQLSTSVTVFPNEPALLVQLGETWKGATRSVGNFTTGLLKFILWLLAYSPYLLIIGLGLWWWRTQKRKS